jgi:hypothetical protein
MDQTQPGLDSIPVFQLVLDQTTETLAHYEHILVPRYLLYSLMNYDICVSYMYKYL